MRIGISTVYGLVFLLALGSGCSVAPDADPVDNGSPPVDGSDAPPDDGAAPPDPQSPAPLVVAGELHWLKIDGAVGAEGFILTVASVPASAVVSGDGLVFVVPPLPLDAHGLQPLEVRAAGSGEVLLSTAVQVVETPAAAPAEPRELPIDDDVAPPVEVGETLSVGVPGGAQFNVSVGGTVAPHQVTPGAGGVGVSLVFNVPLVPSGLQRLVVTDDLTGRTLIEMLVLVSLESANDLSADLERLGRAGTISVD